MLTANFLILLLLEKKKMHPVVLYRVGLLGRSLALQAKETGSIPVRDTSYTVEFTWG